MTNRKVATFQERLAQLVEESGRSQSYIASDFGVAKQTISAWIVGKNSPRQPIVYALSYYFDVSIPWLMGYDVGRKDDAMPESALDHDEARLVRAYRSADERAQQDALNTLLSHPKEQEASNLA